MKIKTILSAALLSGSVLLSAGEYRFFRTSQSPRKCELDAQKQFILFQEGQANFEIVAGKTSVAKFAADELAKQLSRVLGTKITPVAKKSGKKTALIVGDLEFAKKNGINPEALDRDGFYIRSVGTDVVLIGCDDRNNANHHGYFQRGTLFAVYDFLERFAGVRYYFPGDIGTVAPRKKAWSIPAIDIVDRPDSQYRQIYAVYNGSAEKSGKYLYDGYKGSEHYRDREYQLRLLTHPQHSTHGLAYLGLIERFGKTHPEYFALSEKGKRYNGKDVVRCPSDLHGQICFSQEGLKQEIVKDGIALLSGKGAQSRGAVNAKGYPFVSMRPEQRPFFCIMPNDSMAGCQCPGCAPYFTEYIKLKPDQKCSDFVWRWMIDVAKRIQKSGVEGYVTTMCYNPYHLMPPEPLPSNVIVRLALPGPWVKESKFKENMKNLKAWYDKSGGRIALWIYMINGGSRNIPEVPHFTPAAMGKFMKAVAKHSFGTFMECENENYLANYLSYYVFSRVTWDEKTDVAKLLDEHDKVMFGPAAATMKKIRERWEENWLKKIVGNVVDTPLGPVEITPSKTEVWEKIYSKKELDLITSWFNKAEKECASDHDALLRVQFIRKYIWQRTLDEAAAFWKQFDDRKEWKGFMPGRKGEIRIDGKLDEPAWQKAPAYWMLPRKTGKNIPDAVEVHTKVRMLHDKDYFYFGFECEEPHTDKLSHLNRKFDDGTMWVDNIVELFLTPDQKSSLIYQFMVTSANAGCDLRTFQGSSTDFKWNSGMVSQTSVVPGKAWFAEIRIPRKSMPELKGNEIAGNFTRGRKLNDSSIKVQIPYYSWSPAFVRQIPENCGRILLSEVVNKSIILDGGFEKPLHWTKQGYLSPWSNAQVRSETKDFRTDGASASLEKNGSSLFQHLKTAKPDTRYRLSFYMKLENVKRLDKDGGLQLRIANYYPFNQRMHGNSPWRRYQFEFRTPKEIPANYNIWFHFKNASGRVLIDQVEMVEIKK